MATLTGQTIAGTYKDLLQVSNSNSGVDATLRVVSDGEATGTVLYLSSAAAQITSDAKLYFRDTGLYIASNADGDLDIVSDGTAIDSINVESAGGITLDAGTASSGVAYEDDGDEMLRIFNSSSDVIFQIKNDAKDLVVQQYDGYEVVRFSDTRGKMFLYDEGGEYLQSDGTDLTIASGNDINLTATTDINIPSDVGLTFGHASNQKIEGDGTDLAIDATGNINITSTVNEAGSIYVRANAGTSETVKIHSDQGTSVTEGAESVTILSDAGGIGLKSTANLAKAIKLIADGGTSETIYIQSDQGTGADSIELISDAGGVTISAGNTSHGVKVGTVSGAPITIGHTTSETTVADNLTVTGNASIGGNFDVTGTVDFSDSAITNAGDIQLDSITGDGDTNTKITFSGSDVITINTGGSGRLTIGDGALSPVTNNQIDLGTSSLEFKDAFFDGTVTADAFAGPITGAVTGNADTATLSTTVTVTDSTANTNFPVVFHNESNALLDDTGALRYNPSTGELLVPKLTVAGTTTTADTVTMEAANAVIFEGATADSYETTLSIVDPTADHTQYLINQGGYIPLLAAATTTAITSTPAELNILDDATVTTAELNLIDGGTARGTTAVASGDGILVNDAGTMRMTNVDTVSTYFSSHNVGGSNIVTTGTVGTGVWQGTAIASAYLDADTAHLTTTQTFSGAKTFSSGVAIQTASSGATAHGSADELVLHHDGHMGMSFLTPNSGGRAHIYFGDVADNNIGSIVYDLDSNYLSLTTNAAEAMRIDSAGNVGIGKTPESWHSNRDGAVLELGGNASLAGYKTAGASKELAIAQNTYLDQTAGDWVYQDTDEASLIELKNGQVKLSVATSGTAGATVSFTTAMLVLSSGNVGIGVTTPQARLSIAKEGSNAGQYGSGALHLHNTTTLNKYSQILFGYDTGSVTNASAYIGYLNTDAGGQGKGELVFGTRNVVTDTQPTERMRITADGNVGIGDTDPADAKLSIYNNTANDYCLELEQDQAASVLFINQDGNAPAINIDTEATTATVLMIQDAKTTTGHVINVDDADALTSGSAIAVKSNSSSTTARKLVQIINEHASASDAKCLDIRQDGAARGIDIAQNGGNSSIYATLGTGNDNHVLSGIGASADYTGALLQLASFEESADSWQVIDAYHGDNSSNAYTDKIFNVEGNGDVESDTGSYGTGAADYAEYFESTNGSALAVGATVVLEDGKVKVSSAGETPIGVVRPAQGCASVIGNKAQHSWNKKYLRDDYGNFIKENHTLTKWETPDVEYKDGDTIPEGKEIGDRKKNAQKYCYHTDNIPEYEMIPNDGPDSEPKAMTDENGDKIALVVPEDAVVVSVDDDGNQLTRKIINPDYDKSKTYEPREGRDEWNLIGLLGQIPITKGQPMADSWIKMKDISDTVEMYFVK